MAANDDPVFHAGEHLIFCLPVRLVYLNKPRLF